MQHFASPFWLAAALVSSSKLLALPAWIRPTSKLISCLLDQWLPGQETFKHASMLAVSDLDKKLSISGLSTRNQLSHVAGSGLYLGEHFHHVPFRRKG